MRKEVFDYVRQWEQRCYKDGLPDEAPKELSDKVPSYKLIVKAILSNDISVLGINKRPSKAYMEIKRKELKQRGKISDNGQLSLFK